MPSDGKDTTVVPQPSAYVPPTVSPGLAAAADKLEALGRHYRWFGDDLPWRQTDTIGRDEFLAVVQSILDANEGAPEGPPVQLPATYPYA